MSYTITDINGRVKIRDLDEKTKPQTITSVFLDTVSLFGERDALVFKKDGKWEKYSWRKYYNLSRVVASGFASLGLKKGEGVAILGFNSPEWFASNMGTIMAGGVSVGIYATNSSESCEFILKDSNSTIVVVENNDQLQKILSLGSDKFKAIIQYKGQLDQSVDNDNVYDWKSFHALALKADLKNDSTINDIIMSLEPNQCSSLIYTSGTTGKPKGVMLSHDNIIWTTRTVLKTVGITSDEPQRLVSYLPLSHVAGQMIDMYGPLVLGGSTWFAEPTALKGTLVETLVEAQPTIFLGVPRVWEKIMEKMQGAAVNIKGIKKWIATKAKTVGLEHHYSEEIGYDVKNWKWNLCNKLVYTKVRERLGLTHCHTFLTGAAPIKKETINYFASLNIPIFNIYGLSECSGPMTISYKGCSKTGTAGKVVPLTKIKIDPETGEICTFGRNVMMGYLNREDKTNEAIDEEGWLHSGDIGKLDIKDFLHITGRIKELIVTAGGENIPPVLIENKIKGQLPVLSNCMVIGDQRKYLICLVTIRCIVDENGVPTNDLDPTVIKEFENHGIKVKTVTDAMNDNNVLEYIQKGIDRANAKATSRAQRVQKFKILLTDFSIHGGELGPTLKLKRRVVNDKYKDHIEALYNL